MKRKILHDAINNQEDEDSSAHSIYFPGQEAVSKKKKGTVKNNITFSPAKNQQSVDEPGSKREREQRW